MRALGSIDLADLPNVVLVQDLHDQVDGLSAQPYLGQQGLVILSVEAAARVALMVDPH